MIGSLAPGIRLCGAADLKAIAAAPPPVPPAPAPPAKPDPLDGDPDAVAIEIRNNQVKVYKANGSQSSPGDPDPHGVKERATTWLRHFLLPTDFPNGVHEDYLPFRRWKALTNIGGGALEFFATQGILAGMGITGTGTVATVAYFSKNALDSLGKFVGGSMATRADDDPAAWYAKAEVVNAASRAAQMSIMFFPASFWVTAPLSNAAKAYASAMQGAANVNIDNHQSLGQNLGDMQAKNSNQDEITSGIGTALGAGISFGSKFLHAGPWVAPVAVGAFGAINLFAAYRASQVLHMDHVTEIALRRLVHQELRNGKILSPEAMRERSARSLPKGPPVQLGAGLEDLARDPAHLDQLRSLYGHAPYLLDFDGKDIRVALHEDAAPDDAARAVYQAQLLSELAVSPGYRKMAAAQGEKAAAWQAVQDSLAATPADFTAYLRGLRQAGWDTSRIILHSGGTRVRWKPLPGTPPAPLTLDQFRKLLQ